MPEVDTRACSSAVVGGIESVGAETEENRGHARVMLHVHALVFGPRIEGAEILPSKAGDGDAAISDSSSNSAGQMRLGVRAEVPNTPPFAGRFANADCS